MAIDLNSTILAAINPIAEGVNFIINYLKVLVGGVFGLYIIFTLFKFRETITLKKILKELKSEMKHLREDLTIMRDEMNYLKKVRRKK